MGALTEVCCSTEMDQTKNK